MGFLSFNDIQSDYYQIPKSDLEIIKQEEEKAREELSKEVEAKEEKDIAEGKLEIDDPLKLKKEDEKENSILDYNNEKTKASIDDHNEEKILVQKNLKKEKI